ncbi:Cytochrome c-552 precursor [compost metagenome]|jgi:cytochrome c
MNFIYCTAIATLIFANCSFAQTTKKKNIPVKKVTSVVTSAEDIQNGKALIQKSDCMACHKTDVKLVGPGFVQIAKKYPATEANYTLLADKIINGGTGVWGQIPMAAHSTLSKPDAKKMVKYILSLK